MATEKEKRGYIIRGVLELALLITWMIFCFMFLIPVFGMLGYIAMIVVGVMLGYFAIMLFEKAGLEIFKDW
jgi:hypothetical protein